MSIKVENVVQCYGEGSEKPAFPNIVVRSHWNEERMVEIIVGPVCIKVSANDLEAAIKNATNTNRFG